MKKFKEIATKIVVKYGAAIASCAFVFAAVAVNTSCAFPYFEPEEPQGLEKFKKFNK